jgi:hypothetical protein
MHEPEIAIHSIYTWLPAQFLSSTHKIALVIEVNSTVQTRNVQLESVTGYKSQLQFVNPIATSKLQGAI